MHNSERFWRENADRLNDQGFQLLKILIQLLDPTSQTPEVSIRARSKTFSHVVLE